MKKHFRKTLVATAVMGTLASGIPGTASAYVYGVSHLEIQNFLFVSDPTEVTVNSFTFSLTNQASLNNAPSTVNGLVCGGTVSVNNCGPAGAVLDPLAAQQGTPTGENNFGFVGTGSQYARGDSIITGAQLVTGSPSAINMIAENNLLTGSFAQDSAVMQSTTNLTFTALAGAAFSLNFEADADLRVAINELLDGAFSTQSNVTASFTLTRTSAGGGSINWTMDGNLNAADCVVSAPLSGAGALCSETADGGGAADASLNHPLSTGTNLSDLTYSYNAAADFNPYGIDVRGLPAGDYSLALTANVSDNKLRIVVIPEPGSIALLGLGLLGMGVSLRRLNRNA